MKKIICISFMFFVLSAFTYADKSMFYENGKVIDVAYVVPEEGLNARYSPDLKSGKIVTLSYRLPLKILAVGKEDTIDGITAPWIYVEVQYRYMMENWTGDDYPTRFWVFGGYLSKRQPKFIAPRTKKELQRYLYSSQFYIKDTRYYFRIFEDKNMKTVMDISIGYPGTTVAKEIECHIIDNKSFSILINNTSYIVKLNNIGQVDFNISGLKYKRNNTLVEIQDGIAGHLIDGPCLGEYVIYELPENTDYPQWGFCNYGIPYYESEEFMNAYRKYWDPIMEECQKYADSMK